MRKLIIFIMVALSTNLSSQDIVRGYKPSLHGFNAAGFITDTSEIGIHVYLPNDIITVIPTFDLSGGMRWEIVSEVSEANNIITLGCECEIKALLGLLSDFPLSRDNKKHAREFYADLLNERWYE